MQLDERQIAYKALFQWFKKGTFLQGSSLPPFALKIVLGVCRHHLHLEYIIKKNVSKMPEMPVQIILEMGLYQLFFMDGIPDHAAVFTSAALARWNRQSEGSVALINGVLRQVKRNGLPELPPQKIKRISIEYSVPEWIVRRWFDSYGAMQAEEMAKETIQEPVQWIRVNTNKITLKKIREDFDLHGDEYAERYLEVDSNIPMKKLLESREFNEGLFSFQNPAAYDVVSLLKVSSGMKVWDACAAPGGKTSLILEMNPSISLVASDISEERVSKMSDLVERQKLDSVHFNVMDAANTTYNQEFDRILLDVPCSNFGVLSRRPEVVYRTTLESLEALSNMQFEILQGASKALKKNGLLVYATCSQERVETTGVLKRFLAANPDFALEGKSICTGGIKGMDHFFAQALVRQ
ncbi:MAG TPA: transcription antitermination factor NusB [Fibrobacteraceae bacterium]|nr:methyltransferase domain-containing protein [Fibrobacter sp.]HPW95045.1 transcription antitermination factor NusB [Fibrobacteraceae bacterium]